MSIFASIRSIFGTQSGPISLVDEQGEVINNYDMLSHAFDAQAEALKKGYGDLDLLKKGLADGGDEDKFLNKAEKLVRGIEKASIKLLETNDKLLEEAADLVSKASEEGQKKVKKVMDEWKEGKLNSSDGDKVENQKQAIAIALSEAGLSKKKKKKELSKDEGGLIMEADNLDEKKAMDTGNTSGYETTEGKQSKKDNQLSKAEEGNKYQGNYANTLIYNYKGEILFLKRSSDQKIEPNKWGLPGGHIDEGETPDLAAIRETKEEANIEVNNLLGLGKIKCQDGKWAYYFSGYINRDNAGSLAVLDGESTNARWMSKEQWEQADLMFDLKAHLEALVIKGFDDLKEVKVK